MTTADEAAHQLAKLILDMRIEVRKMAFSDPNGHIDDTRWHKVYEALRLYEDAQVRDMLEEPGRRRRRKRRIRHDKKKSDAIPTETRRKPKLDHPWRHPTRS